MYRLFGPAMPTVWTTTDGAELGKVMVAEGLGHTCSRLQVLGYIERAGLITVRPIANDSTTVTLVLQRRPRQHLPRPVRDLEAALVTHGRAHRAQRVGTQRTEATS